ncbi:hypothetical protein [Rubrobacter aplysinae]|nr:hypothetical protein [Rubrobacter aplysinae]
MVDGIEFITDAIIGAIAAVLSLLPQHELGNPLDNNRVLGAVNYFLPLGIVTAGFSGIMTAWIAYRVYQWLVATANVE